MRAPYNAEEIARNIRQNIPKTDFKNKEISCAEFAKLAGISESTARNWDDSAYDQIGAYLGRPYSITSRRCAPRESMKIKVSGCHYGPFGLIAWPIGPRIYERVNNFIDRIIEFRQESFDIRVGERKARTRRLGNFFPLLDVL